MTRVGSERIGGQATTHYHALLKRGDSGGLPADVWIDSRHRIRRARVVVVQSVPTRTASPSLLTLTVDFSGFGVPVTVTAPPPAQMTRPR